MTRVHLSLNSLEERIVPSFLAPRVFAGPGPYGLVTADLNNDTLLDVVAGQVSNKVSVYLGNGDGTLQAHREFTSAGTASKPGTGDINGDGNVDIVASSYDTDSVGVLVGDGTGSFALVASYPVGDRPDDVKLADIENDRDLDIITANEMGTISVLLNQGNGSFHQAIDYLGGSGTRRVALADYNGDTKLDAAVVNAFGPKLGILIGNGNGTFQMPQYLNFAIGIEALTVGDLNGDGRKDLANANSNGTLNIMFGSGGGNFNPPIAYATSKSGTNSIALVDLNGDDALDVAVSNGSDVPLNVFFNKGNGVLRSARPYGVGSGSAVASGDFNGDGATDLVSSVGAACIWLNRGNGDLQTSTLIRVPGNPLDATFADVTGDGVLDFIASSGDTSAINVLFGRGDGSFGKKLKFAAGDFPSDVVVADFDSDGAVDVAVANFNAETVTVLRNNGKGAFPTKRTYPNAPTRPHALATGDVNSDGYHDLVAAGDQGELSVYLGQGNGGFAGALQASILFGTLDVALADLNGDGNLDAVLGRQFSAVSILFGNGDGTFSAGPNHGTGGADDIHVVVADLDTDGDFDVAAAGGSSARVLLNNGTGSFAQPQSIPTSVGARTIDIGDPNGDGIIDLVTGGFGVSFVMGKGDGTFFPGAAYALGPGLFDAIVADLNSDGFDDVIGTVPSYSFLSVALGASGRSALNQRGHNGGPEDVLSFRRFTNRCADEINDVQESRPCISICREALIEQSPAMEDPVCFSSVRPIYGRQDSSPAPDELLVLTWLM